MKFPDFSVTIYLEPNWPDRVRVDQGISSAVHLAENNMQFFKPKIIIKKKLVDFDEIQIFDNYIVIPHPRLGISVPCGK